MPYCTSCGSEVSEEMSFCPQCGGGLVIPKTGEKLDKVRDSTVGTVEKEPENIVEQKARRGKLYKQWVAYAGLPSGEIRSTKTSRGVAGTGRRSGRSLTLLYILLGVSVAILLMALVFLLAPYF